MNKTKILLLTNSIPHYRIPVYNLLNTANTELTVAHSGKDDSSGKSNFNQLYLETKKLGPFILHSSDLFKLCNGYDVVIVMFNVRWLSLMRLVLNKKRSFKIILWGIGVSASYTNRYDEVKYWDFVRFFFGKMADAILFYDKYPISKYLKAGFEKEKLFVAPNTVHVSSECPEQKRSRFLFIGSLYKEKGIFELLEAYEIAKGKKPDLYPLDIIGGGTEMENVLQWIKLKNLTEKIIVHGPIYDEKILNPFLNSAVASISPKQAGLSILNCFAKGVPFITRGDAISGGEVHNILNGYNGFIYQNGACELSELLTDLFDNKEKAEMLSQNAKHYYNSERNVSKMVDGFKNAISFVLNW
jgi:glycosyltransferase involved in cell wall biosynthesis